MVYSSVTDKTSTWSTFTILNLEDSTQWMTALDHVIRDSNLLEIPPREKPKRAGMFCWVHPKKGEYTHIFKKTQDGARR